MDNTAHVFERIFRPNINQMDSRTFALTYSHGNTLCRQVCQTFAAAKINRTNSCDQERAIVSRHATGLRNTPMRTGVTTMAEGKIKRKTDRGFGFIDDGTEKDMFFHSSSVQNGSFDELREGQLVSYDIGQGPKGPRAENVKVV